MAGSAKPANPIGDVVRALVRLDAHGSAMRKRILGALGWADRQAIPPLRSAPAQLPAPGPDLDQLTKPTVDPTGWTQSEQRAAIPSSISKLKAGDARPPEGLDESVGLLPLPRADTYVPLYEKAIEPLFVPAYSRAIFGRSIAVPRPIGEVDVSSVVDLLGRGQPPLTHLPRRALPSLSGLQLLIASDSGLDPFRVDIESMVRQIAGIAGRDRLQILAFAGCPVRGLYEPSSGDLVPYRPPASGTSVLAISDLGACQPDRQRLRTGRDWRVFARLLAGRGVPLTVLNPYPLKLASSSLRKHLRVVVWDRVTSVRSVVLPTASAESG